MSKVIMTSKKSCVIALFKNVMFFQLHSEISECS